MKHLHCYKETELSSAGIHARSASMPETSLIGGINGGSLQLSGHRFQNFCPCTMLSALQVIVFKYCR